MPQPITTIKLIAQGASFDTTQAIRTIAAYLLTIPTNDNPAAAGSTPAPEADLPDYIHVKDVKPSPKKK